MAGRTGAKTKEGRVYSYRVYGVQLRSSWPLPYPEDNAAGLAEVSLLKGSAALISDALDGTVVPANGAPCVRGPLGDGSTYVRWPGLFEFLIASHGRSLRCRPLSEGAFDAFRTHLSPSLSFALINLGIEPLHSTTVVIDGSAVALMGDCGYGKSSLGAEFVRAGHQLLTDDLLVVRSEGRSFVAYPGAPRVKLFSEIAAHIFGPDVQGVELKHLTPKVIIPLDSGHACQTIVPLKAIYVLTPPSPRALRVGIRRLSRRQAFLEMVRNTFNVAVTDAARLRRQFLQATHLASVIPTKSLSYPRVLSMLPAAREAILFDLAR